MCLVPKTSKSTLKPALLEAFWCGQPGHVSAVQYRWPLLDRGSANTSAMVWDWWCWETGLPIWNCGLRYPKYSKLQFYPPKMWIFIGNLDGHGGLYGFASKLIGFWIVLTLNSTSVHVNIGRLKHQIYYFHREKFNLTFNLPNLPIKNKGATKFEGQRAEMITTQHDSTI